MSNYKKMLKEMKEKVEAAGSSRHSRSDFTLVTQTLLNSPDEEINVFVKEGEPVKTKPAERYRDSLKPVLKEFGVDSAELGKVQQIQFGKEHAEALNELAMQSIKDYTATGRKLVFPITSDKESQMSLQQVKRDKTVTDTTKLEQQEDGSYKSVPTGIRKTTEEHYEMKASNKVPGWLITKEQK